MRIALVCLLLIITSAPLLAQAPPEARDGRKAVVLGIDALDHALMRQWMDEGYLPTFAALAEDGQFERLETVWPPMSPVAWSSMSTGLNPGKTGVFGFLKRQEGSYEPAMALVDPNETPVLGVSRLELAIFGGIGLMLLSLPLGALLFVLIRGRPVHDAFPGGVLLVMLLLTPFPQWHETLADALTGLLLMFAGACVFAYFVWRNRLKPRVWPVAMVVLGVGVYMTLLHVPDTLPAPRTDRSGATFWKLADDAGLRTRVIGAPVNWPAREGLKQSKTTTGLATPDAMGTYHTYTLFTEPQNVLAGGTTEMSGRVERLRFEDGRAGGVLLGPPAKFDRARWQQWERGELARMPREEIPFTVTRGPGDGVTVTFPAELATEAESFELQPGQWQRHFRLAYNLGGVARLHGTVSFKLLAGGSQVRLYATPVQFDPLKPDERFAISEPLTFAPWLAEFYGMYQTIGWAEATSALNDRMIDDETFLETCHHSFEEKRAQILGLLERPREWDLLVAFTYEVDRVSHMMWRHMDAAHPYHDPAAPEHWKTAIRDFYVLYDGLLAEVLERLPQNTLLLLCSDHGFAPFYRAVNVNRWLEENGYLVLKERTGDPTMAGLFDGGAGYYGNYDWSRTRAYAHGLTNISLNLRGRDPEGIVNPGAEAEVLKDEIIAGLLALRDDGNPVFRRVMRAEDVWEGPRVPEAGDLQLGYHSGYRVSWRTSLGGADEPVIFDNRRNWSGDHCSFDPEVVPGVVFSNYPVRAERYSLMDVGLTALAWLGVPQPENLGDKDGRAWAVQDRSRHGNR
jgi:predicted AlkP superfamily phosphohydrolase/phosphomutase